MIFAIVGVIPFGSLGKGVGPFFGDLAGGLATSAGRTAIAANAGQLAGATRSLSGLVGSGRPMWSTVGNSYRMATGAESFVGATIGRVFGYTGQTDGLSIVAGIWGDGHGKQLFGIPDGVAEVFGPGALHNGIPGLDARVPWAPTR